MTRSRTTTLFLLMFVSTLLANCGGDSGVGKQSDTPPRAKAEVFGAGQLISGTVEVRSGKDVLLSGANSISDDDPILSFSWRQIDSSGYTVALYERSTNTVVFEAPAVPLDSQQGVDLIFELTATDADGVEASDRVTVRVKPAYDSNKFLLNPRVNESFVIIVAAPEGTELASDIPFSLNMSVSTVWTDRRGTSHELEVDNKTFSGAVAAGVQATIGDRSNTYFTVPVPLLDADEVNVNFKGEQRSSRLEFEAVKDAYLSIETVLTPMAGAELAIYLARASDEGFTLLDTEVLNAEDTRLSFSDEWLRHNLLIESRRSANNYYDCIDPLRRARTLDDWIEAAGFNEYPDTVVHTSYVNNYDLNFGRDMFVRKDENGNVYSYVTNYPNLENIFSGRNEFAVVVMEYSAAPTGHCGDGTFADDVSGEKIVKFYSYVPNRLTGEYDLAPTMNFDGRGERAVPGVCVACHYGDTNAEQFNTFDISNIDASFADLNSSFMPWDLDAFLYTQSTSNEGVADPVYLSGDVIVEEITRLFSRETQEPLLRLQNQMVLDTFTHDLTKLKRFETPIKMLHGWYGNRDAIEDLDFGSDESPLSEEAALALKAQVATLPANEFDGEYLQKGWEGEEELYHQVFARNCRLCHAQVADPNLNFDTYEEFINNEQLTSYVFEQGVMPLSRLTMDRFWVDFYNDLPAAEILRQHINSDDNPNNDIAPGTVPGYPVARVVPNANPDLAADIFVNFGERVLFDATNSLFANSFEWSIDGVFASQGNKFEFTASDPGAQASVSVEAIDTDAALISRTLIRRVAVIDNAPNAEGVASPTVNEGESVEVNIFTALCPGGAPDSQNCRPAFGDIRSGEVPQLELVGDSANGTAVISDAATGRIRFTSDAPSDDGDGEFSFTLIDSFGEVSAPAAVSVTVNPLQGPQLVLDTCTVSTYISSATLTKGASVFDGTDCANPLANDSAADGLGLQITALGNPDKAESQVSLSSGIVSYTPGRFFLGNDSFIYTATDDSPSQRSARQTVQITVQPTQTFTSLTDGILGASGCAACHNGAGSYPEIPVWRNHSVFSRAVRSTDNNIDTLEIDLNEDTTRQMLLSAVIFQQACSTSHTGGNLLCQTGVTAPPTNINQLNDSGREILRWIEEGTYNN